MTANLVIVLSNPQPNRERRYPGTWLLYKEGQGPVEVQVEPDDYNIPHVRNRVAV